MSDYLRPEYTPLFTQVQDFIADQLNTDPQLSALGIEFLPEHRLDIEYEIKNNLGKQGTVGIVNTLKGTYGGHNGSTNAWEIEAEVDVLENPPVRRAQMKKMGLSAGSTADILDWVQESLCAPSSPTYGKFCAVSQELGEDRGIIVGRSIMKTFAIADISAVVSGEHQWVCPYALWSDLSALQEQVYDLSVDVHGDYIEDLSANVIYANRTAQYIEEVANWTDVFYPDDPLIWDAENNWWRVDVSPSFYMKLQFNSGTWTLETGENVGGEWVIETDSVQDTQEATVLTFSISGESHTFNRGTQQIQTTGELALKSDLPTKTSDLTNDSGFITSADIITKRDLNDFHVYVDPMADMTTTKFTVVVSYAGDPTYPLFTVELTHTGGDAATWSWSPSGSNQSISIDYSSVTGKYNLHYYNIQDGGGNEHSGGMNLPLTSPYWTGEAQDDWFHFSITSQTTTIATKEYVDSQIGQLLNAQF